MIRGTTEVGADLSDTEGPSCHTVTTAPSPSPGAVRPHACCCGELPAQTRVGCLLEEPTVVQPTT